MKSPWLVRVADDAEVTNVVYGVAAEQVAEGPHDLHVSQLLFWQIALAPKRGRSIEGRW